MGEVSIIGNLYSGLSYSIYKNDTLYKLEYKNSKHEIFEDYKSIQFTNSDGAVDTLCGILKSFFSAEHEGDDGYNVNFKLGENNITANRSKDYPWKIMVSTKDGFF